MKKLILAAALFILPSTAHANIAQLCPSIGELAGIIMEVRQAGVSKEAMLATVKPNIVAKLTISLVNQAYLTPIYFSESLRQKTIASFKNEAEYICYKAAAE
jgi:hypothetical protein